MADQPYFGKKDILVLVHTSLLYLIDFTGVNNDKLRNAITREIRKVGDRNVFYTPPNPCGEPVSRYGSKLPAPCRIGTIRVAGLAYGGACVDEQIKWLESWLEKEGYEEEVNIEIVPDATIELMP